MRWAAATAAPGCNGHFVLVEPESLPLGTRRLRLGVLMTCHNRCRQTQRCVESVLSQRSRFETPIQLVVCDDGSSDGTRDMLESYHESITVVEGGGSLYWSGGMRKAFAQAFTLDLEFYLWLNDDVVLYPGALATLLNTWFHASEAANDPIIVVGTTCDPELGRASYGGLVTRPGRRRLNLKRVYDPEVALQCDTFNGNCVLISRRAASMVGNLDARFTHNMGDLDYGFRACKAGCALLVAPGYVGECSTNNGRRPWADGRLSLGARWALLTGPKCFPFRAWWTFSIRYGGRMWVLHWLKPYVKFWLCALGHTFTSAHEHR